MTSKDTMPGRNNPCPCGSGRKYKLCCGCTSVAAADTRGPAATIIGPNAIGRMLERHSPLHQAIQRNICGPPGRGGAPPAPARAARQQAAIRLRLAARLRAEGRLVQAHEAAQNAVLLDSGNPVAHFELGQLAALIGRYAEAAVAFRQVLVTQPRNADAWLHLGLALDALNEAGGAVDAYRHALDLSPGLAAAVGPLTMLLVAEGREQEAIERLHRAAAANSGSLAGRILHAKALMLAAKDTEAERELQRVLALSAGNSDAIMTLGIILSRNGRFNEARKSFRRVIDLEPKQWSAYFALFNITKATETDRPLLEHIGGMVRSGRFSDPSLLRLLFALGKGHDDLNEPEAAMQAFDKANCIRGRLYPLDRAAYQEDADWLMRSFTAQTLDTLAGHGSAEERPIFIVGMPRSGTTLVEQIVSSHPQVAAGGELTFWITRGAEWRGVETGRDPAALIAELTAGYRNVLSGISATAPRVTDKNPYNVRWMPLIHLAFPNARFIHCRRHPVDTCLSIYTTLFTARTEFASNRADLVFYYRQYQQLSDRWRSIIPADRQLELDYETLVADREAQTKRLIAFCGLTWDDSCLAPERNDRAVQTASVWQARQPVYTSSVGRWRRYEPWLGELRELLKEADG